VAASTDSPQRILLLDVDGTLVDSYPGIRDSFLRALEDNEIPAPGDDVLSRLPGPPMIDTLRTLGLTDDELEHTFASYRAHYESDGWQLVDRIDGIAELLADWKSRGFILATATSKATHSARRALEHFDLLRYIDVVGAAEDGTDPAARRGKKDVIRYTLGLLDQPTADIEEGGPTARPDILMIGDRIHDVEGAHAFGIRAALVDWGYGGRDEHDRADYSVADVGELRRLVDNWADPRPHLCIVCTGNICRSAMGEIMLRSAFEQAGIADAVRLNSCGTEKWHVGEAADPRAVAQLQQDGFQGSGHRAAQFGPEHRDADLFLVMTTAHAKSLVKLGVDPDRIRLFRSFGPAGDREVEDPYYGGDDGFAQVSHQLAEAIPGIVTWAQDAAGR
jgi:phosphoglycolate phosphatase